MSAAIDPELRILELRDSTAWAAGVGYERRRIDEIIRQRAILLYEMPGRKPRRTIEELLRLAEVIDEAA